MTQVRNKRDGHKMKEEEERSHCATEQASSDLITSHSSSFSLVMIMPGEGACCAQSTEVCKPPKTHTFQKCNRNMGQAGVRRTVGLHIRFRQGQLPWHDHSVRNGSSSTLLEITFILQKNPPPPQASSAANPPTCSSTQLMKSSEILRDWAGFCMADLICMGSYDLIQVLL